MPVELNQSLSSPFYMQARPASGRRPSQPQQVPPLTTAADEQPRPQHSSQPGVAQAAAAGRSLEVCSAHHISSQASISSSSCVLCLNTSARIPASKHKEQGLQRLLHCTGCPLTTHSSTNMPTPVSCCLLQSVHPEDVYMVRAQPADCHPLHHTLAFSTQLRATCHSAHSCVQLAHTYMTHSVHIHCTHPKQHLIGIQ